MTDNPVMALAATRNTIANRVDSAKWKKISEAQTEIQNILTLMGGMLEHHLEVDDVVTEMVDQQGSYIEPDIADHLFATFTLAMQMVNECRALVIGLADDLKRKRVLALATETEHALELSSLAIQNIVTEEDDEDGDDGDTNDGDDGDDDDDEEEGTGTPQKTPTGPIASSE